MATVKIMSVETIEMDNVKVTYVTGTEKIYPVNKMPKTVAAWIEKNMATEETEEPETIETEEPAAEIETEEPKQEPENVRLLNLDGTRRTGGIVWGVTQIFLPLAGLVLTIAAHGVGYLADVAYMLATVAGWINPKYERAVQMIKATAGRIRRAAEREWKTIQNATPVILETVKAYTVQAMEFRADIIAQDKPVDEF